MSVLLEIKNVTAGYGDKTVLDDISLSVAEGDFIGVIGPNGGGKTTLLKLMLGMVKPFKGNLYYNESLIARRNIGYLPQISHVDNAFPLVVKDIVLSGLMMHKKPFSGMVRADRERALTIIRELGLQGYEKATLSELSGGQIQRVFLGRALAGSPRILLLDEPDNFVDTSFESEFYLMLRELNRKMSILMASHDVGTISSYVKSFACVNRKLHYHPSPEITSDQLSAYDCPIQLVTHGRVPHTILEKHD